MKNGKTYWLDIACILRRLIAKFRQSVYISRFSGLGKPARD